MKKKIAKLLRRIANGLDPEIRLSEDAPMMRTPYNSTTATLQRVEGAFTFSDNPEYARNQRANVEAIKQRLAEQIGLELYRGGFIKYVEDNEPIPAGRDILRATLYAAKKN